MRSLLTTTLIVLVLPVERAAAAVAPPPTRVHEIRVIRDVAYHKGPDHDAVRHKLDLYLPKNLKSFPVVLFVHGGGWTIGSKDVLGYYPTLARALAQQGVGVAVTNYRLSPGVQHPEHIKDVARAFAWTAKHIATYGGDPRRLFLSGHSAGGHLASLLTVDDTYLRAVGLTRKAICGVIPISGVYVFPQSFLPRVFGADPMRTRQAAPIVHAQAGLPPFLIVWADDDFALCGAKPSGRFASALREKGNRVQTCEVHKTNHYTIVFRVATRGSEVSRSILNFIRTNSR